MKKWSISFRIWHWVHAFVVFALLGTVFLRKTFLSWKSNSEIIAAKLSEFDVAIGAEQAKIIANAIRAPMWEWHIILGYVLAGLIVIRVLFFFTESGKRSFKDYKTASLHKKMVKAGYTGIYMVLSFMALSGLVLTFHEELGLLKTTVHDIKEIHELVFNFVWVFAVLHIAGVIVADNRDEKGIVSDMINGGEA